MSRFRVVKEVTPAWVVYTIQEKVGLFRWKDQYHYNHFEEAVNNCKFFENRYRNATKSPPKKTRVVAFQPEGGDRLSAFESVVVGVVSAALIMAFLFGWSQI